MSLPAFGLVKAEPFTLAQNWQEGYNREYNRAYTEALNKIKLSYEKQGMENDIKQLDLEEKKLNLESTRHELLNQITEQQIEENKHWLGYLGSDGNQTQGTGVISKLVQSGIQAPATQQQAPATQQQQAPDQASTQQPVQITAQKKQYASKAPLQNTEHTLGATILNWEARRDKEGNLKVYNLRPGDGGGKKEVAGINDRFHAPALKRLESMLGSGQFEAAESFAANYLEEYGTSTPMAGAVSNPGLLLAVADATVNRGPTGATRIVQHALGVPVDGVAGPKTLSALKEAESNPEQFLSNFEKSREWYERKYANRAPGNQFWDGLVNRWKNQREESQRLSREYTT